MTQKLSMDQPLIYRIEVQGRLDERWSDWFDGTSVTMRNVEGLAPITSLTGVIADQAALQGLLRSLYSSYFPILAVTLLEPNSKGVSGDPDAGVDTSGVNRQ